MLFSGTRASGARTAIPVTVSMTTAVTAAVARQGNVSLVGAEGQDDEGDFEPFEQHAPERQREGIPIGDHAPALGAGSLGGGQFGPVDSGLVMTGLEPAGSQDRLAQPLQPEDQQQAADHQT